MVVTSAICQTRDLAWLRRAIDARADAHCTVTDVTSGVAMLGVMGPRSRELLQSCRARTCRMLRIRSGTRAKSRSATRESAPAASLTSANSAGNSICRRSIASTSTSACSKPGVRLDSSLPATTRWAPAASRKATGTGATTSPTRTLRSKRGSDSRSPGTSRAASLGATRCWRKRRAARCSGASCRSCWTMRHPPHRCSITRNRSCATASSSGRCARAPGAIASNARSAWVTSPAMLASRRRGSPRAAGRSKSPASATPRACSCSPGTTRRNQRIRS